MSLIEDIATENNIKPSDVESALDLINTELEVQTQETKEVMIPPEKEITFDGIAQKILERVNVSDDNANMMMDHFMAEILQGKDRSESSKVLLGKILEEKNNSTAHITELAKAIAKIQAAKLTPAKGGVFVAVKNGEEAGISLDNLRDE